MTWDGSGAEKRLIDYARDDNGDIQKGKIDKYFGRVDGDGSLVSDYHYPLGDVVGGKPQYDEEGLHAAFAAARGSHGQGSSPEVAKKIAEILKREFPDSVTAGVAEKLKGKAHTPEYLAAFHDHIMGHPAIPDQIKQAAHKTARGSAGGQLKGKGILPEEEAMKTNSDDKIRVVFINDEQ